MPPVLSTSRLRTAPGATVTLAGTGLSGATFALLQQGALRDQTTPLAGVTIAADGSSASFQCPDGADTGQLQITGADGAIFSAPLSVASQYVFADEYQAAGEGDDLTGLADGELDRILQKASGYVDARIGRSLRYLQRFETFRRQKTRRVYPRHWPIVSVDYLKIVASQQLFTAIPTTDLVFVSDRGYIEVLSNTLVSYEIFGVLSNLGFVADIMELTYTAGFKWAEYPQGLKDATIMVASELLTMRSIKKAGLAGFDRVKQNQTQYDRRTEPFAMPAPALELLQEYADVIIR